MVAAESPATFTFTLRNNSARERTYWFELDGYEGPDPRPCTDDGGDPTRRLERHRRANHPVPEDFDVQIAPAAPTLAAGNSITITVIVDPPVGFRGRQPINVNAFNQQGFAGGVTLVVVKEP